MLENRRIRFAAALVLLAAAGVYANTLPYGAAWDDTRFVFQSGATQGIAAFGDLLTSPYLRDVPAGRSPYRPVTAISYALDWTLGGGRASFFHWTNVLLHVGVTGLLMAVMGALMVPTAGVIVGGAWFAVHPVHVEAVANLAGRAELLAAFFGLLTILLYLRGSGERRPDSRTSTPLLLGSALLSFAFALGAKENAVVVVPLLVLVELLRGRGNPWRERLRRWPFWVGLTALAAGYMLLRRSILGTFTTHDVAPFILNLPPGTRVATAVANWLEYARLMVFPVDLVVDYGPAVIMPSAPVSLGVLWGLMVLASCVGLCAILWRRTRLPALGALWFAAAVLPVSNLLVPIAQWLAERFLYMPSAGFALALGGAVVLVEGRPAARRWGSIVAVSVLVLLAARTWTRNSSWRDTETVAATLLTEHPEAFRSQWLMGSARLAAGDTEVGMRALERAIELNPGAMELHLERASWLLRLGRASEAESALRRLPAGMHPDREANLARSLAAQGAIVEAREVLDAALAAFPTNASLSALADSIRR